MSAHIKQMTSVRLALGNPTTPHIVYPGKTSERILKWAGGFLAVDGHLGARDLCRKSSLHPRDNDAQIAGSHRRLILRIRSVLACFVSCCGGLLLVASIILNASHFVRNVSGPASAIIVIVLAGEKIWIGKCADTPPARRKCTGIKIKHDRRFTSSHL